MAKRQMPYGGAPRIGGDAPGEPSDSPVAQNQDGFGGGKTINTTHNRGVRALNPNGAGEVFPTPYGGGNAFVKRPNQKPARGSGDGTGAGATSVFPDQASE